ncbi:MAG: SDR family oxidoreductase [Victivallales bacterium]|nr:SDR family oxidoreductase [Victivallales bacterium]
MEQSDNNNRPVVLVTGGGRRIGACVCRAFGAAGWRVAVHCGRSLQAAGEVAESIGGGRAAVFSADLRDDRERDGVIPAVLERFGRIDVLVNNASAYVRRPLSAVSAQTLREDLEINFTAPFALMCSFREAAGSAGGNIVNILDSRIQWPDGDSAGYSLAKSALAQGTLLCAREWAAAGIRVNGIAPGFVMPAEGVPMERMAHLVEASPLKRRCTPEEIADSALWLVNAPSVTGQIIYLDGGLHLPAGGKGEKV